MSDDNMLVLVEFEDAGTLRRVSADEADPDELAELSGRSREAVEKTLSTIGWIARRAKTLVSEAEPDEVELEFGVKISTKAGVIVMQADGEFHIKAKITWRKP
ncbi:MAG: hypothetical protein K8S97_07560 [Anaerolineae bacterium]|nr:hypothetical protein [Anaerolineae bacterium]